MKRQISPALALITVTLAFAAVSLVSLHATGLTGVQWTQVGPAPLQINSEQNYQGAGPDSGEVVDIAIDPRGTTDQTVYIASGSGGVWKSTDNGTTWKPLSDNLLTLSTGAVGLDPGNPSIVYAGTSNPAFGGDCPGCNFRAVGIYKSFDGGNTWALLPNSPTGVAIRKIVFPAPGVLLVATTGGLYRSLDAGNNFSRLTVSGSPGNGINDIRLDTQNPTTVRVSISGLGIFVSNSDVTAALAPTFTNLWTASNGSPLQNTTVAGGNIGFIAFAQSTTVSGNTIYATVQNTTPTTPAPSRFLGMWVSTDGGSTWTNLPGANAAGGADGNSGGGCQCGYDQTIGVDPTNDQTVYIGFQEVWKSTDGGGSFSGSAITASKVHWDNHAFLFSPHDTSGQTFYIGTDGGVATTSDGGGSFSNINGSTSAANGAIASNLLRLIDIGRGSDSNRQWTYGGFQDTGNAQFGSGYTGTTWQLGQDGDGGPVAVDPCDPTHALSTDDGGYSQTTSGGSGGSWSGSVTLSPAVPGGFRLSASAFAFDQTCDSTVYAGFNISDPTGVVATTFGLYQSTDNGNNYTQVYSPTTAVVSIATVKIDPNVVWVGLNNGGVAFSTNALSGVTATWTTLPSPSGNTQAALGIAIDPINTDTVFVVYPGVSGASPSRHIFETTDRGADWADVSGTGPNGLPDLPLHAVAIDPGTGNTSRTVIVGGDGGVFQTTNDGASWQVLGLNLPTVGVTAVALDSSVSPSLLRVGTYGRSSFELTAPTGPLLAVNADLAFGTVCAGQPTTRIVQIFNVGSSDLHISSFTRVSGSTDFAIISGPSGPVTVHAGGEIDYTIKFSPTTTGSETATFQINSDDPNQPALQLFASGVGGSPTIAVTGSTTFGDVCAGGVAEKTISICNAGMCDLHVTSAAFAAACPDFTLVNSPFPATVSHDSCLNLTIRFTPTSAGAKSCNLVISSDDPVTPSVTLAVTANTSTSAIGVPGDQIFPPTVVQNLGPCKTSQLFPISNTGSCNLTVTNIAISGTNAGDYSIAGLPTFPTTVQAGEVLGDGALSLVFAPTALARSRSATVSVTYVSDPATNTTTTISQSLCGESVNTGARVLVTHGGVPLPMVDKIFLKRVKKRQTRGNPVIAKQTTLNAPLQTVAAPCQTFQFHQEWGGASNPVQLLTGDYQLQITVKIAGHKVVKVTAFSIDTCTFDQTIVVDL